MHQKQKDWDMVGPLDDRSVKGLLMEDKEIAEKLNKCFALSSLWKMFSVPIGLQTDTHA